MEEGTFVTGIELIGNTPQFNASQIETKSRQDLPASSVLKTASANKPNRSGTAANRSLQPLKTEQFPVINNAKDASAKSVMRNSLTESNFKKPLFQKIANVKDFYDKTKGPNDMNSGKLRSSTSVASQKPLNHWKSREENDPKNFTHADAFNLKIVQKYDDMYKTKRGFAETMNAESLAKRKHFFDEVEKQEGKLQSELKKYNNMAYDIQRKEELLASLQKQDAELQKKFEDNSTLENLKIEKQAELAHWEEQIEVTEHKHECLTHMKHLKKELLLNIHKNYQKHKEAFDHQQEIIGLENKKAEYERTLIGKKKYEAKDLRKKTVGKDQFIDPEFEDLIQSEVSEFEERRNIREILKHEKVIEEEIRQQEADEVRRIQEARENRLRQEENRRMQKEAEHEKELDEIKELYHEFQKVTHVSRKEQLLEYYDGLEGRGEVLETEIETVNEDIKAKKEELKELRKQLKFKKFEETKVSKDNFPTDIRFDDLEVMLRQKQNEAGERENHIKRLDKLSYEVCTVISRIFRQLQKSKTTTAVDKNNVVELLSVCGMKLEGLLTVVIKKKKTFFIESINTDGTIKEGPPSYMNIVSDDVFNKSKKRIERDGPFDLGEELEDDYLSNVRDQLKHKYEGNDM